MLSEPAAVVAEQNVNRMLGRKAGGHDVEIPIAVYVTKATGPATLSYVKKL